MGSPLHFTLWWKQRVGNKVGGGAGNKALVGFNLRSAGGHTERGSNQSAISKCYFYTFYETLRSTGIKEQCIQGEVA